MITTYPPATTTVIDFAHYETHSGNTFSGGYYNSSLADASSIDILIQNGSTSTYHMICAAAVSGTCTMQVFEGATFSNAGTSVTMTNHNRTSAKTFSGTVTHTPTLTGTGTQLNGTQLIPGGDKHSVGVSGSFTSEIILAKSTNYLVRLTNISGGAIKASAHIEGYQPTL